MPDVNWGIDAYLGGSWVDITTDIRLSHSITMRNGLNGSEPDNRIAETGMLTFALDNSTANSGGKLGYYSPNHANCRSGWGLGVRLRFWIQDSTATKRYKFHGKVANISPSFGMYRERIVEIQAVDYMEHMAQVKLNLLTVQVGKRIDEVLQTIIAALPIAPLATSYAASPNTLAYALHNDQDEKTTAMSAAVKCLKSDLGYLFVAGDNANGETLTYQSRYSRFANLTPVAVLNDAMDELAISQKTEAIFNDVRVTTHPIRFDTSGTQVLATAQTEFKVPAGGSINPVFRYRDPSGNERISGYNMLTPVAGTDYRFTANPNSGGSELNGSISIISELGANSAQLTISNSGAVDAYSGGSELFQIRGQGVYLYDAVESRQYDQASGTTYGKRTLNYDMPYQSDINVGDAFAVELLSRNKNPHSIVDAVRFSANRSTTLLDYAANREIGDRITITESATGINADYFINGKEYQITAPHIMFVRWILEAVASVGKIGMWGTDASDSGVWGSSSADATDWVF